MSDSRDRKKKPQRSRASGGNRGKGQPARSAGGRSKGKATRSQHGGTPRQPGGRARREERNDKQQKLPAAAAGLPRHVVESLMRVTPANRQNAALAALGAAAEAFTEGQHHTAVRKAEHAKDLSPRDSTIREILGLSAYRVGDWQKALRELRTYRRLSGETTHMPVEMDILRALERPQDVEATWQEFRKLGGGPAAKKEARVVYASHLIDQEDLDQAAQVAGTPRKTADPWPEDLRLWYVAARIAALRGEKAKARALADDIVLVDPSFPGLDELDRVIDIG
jgi:tetratricopeptide (TPR) repeat protein